MDEVTSALLADEGTAILANIVTLALGGFLASQFLKVTRPLRRITFILLSALAYGLVTLSSLPWLFIEPAIESGMTGLITISSFGLMFIYGVATYWLSARRSIDITGTTRKAWWGFIPLLNLVLYFQGRQTPPYEPGHRSKLSRFVFDPVLVLVALLIFTTFSLVTKVFENDLAQTFAGNPALIQSIHGQESVEESLAREVARASAELPMQVDEVTMLTSLDAQGNTMTYGYVVDGGITSLDAEFGSVFTRHICGGPAIAYLVARGARVVSTYRTPDGRFIASFEVTQADCAAGVKT